MESAFFWVTPVFFPERKWVCACRATRHVPAARPGCVSASRWRRGRPVKDNRDRDGVGDPRRLAEALRERLVPHERLVAAEKLRRAIRRRLHPLGRRPPGRRFRAFAFRVTASDFTAMVFLLLAAAQSSRRGGGTQ